LGVAILLTLRCGLALNPQFVAFTFWVRPPSGASPLMRFVAGAYFAARAVTRFVIGARRIVVVPPVKRVLHAARTVAAERHRGV
jgi:hypothetical protein